MEPVFVQVSEPADLEECIELRQEVFVKEQKVPADLEIDEYDHLGGPATHVMVKIHGGCCAAGRWIPYNQDAAKLQRIVVKKELRGTGLGMVLMEGMERSAAAAGYTEAVLDAQLQAELFYKKNGYTRVSDQIFLDAGIEHVRMKKSLK